MAGPRAATRAGARTPRTMVASMMMPSARAVARILTSTVGTRDRAMKARNRMRAALVTRRPVRATPWTVASSVWWPWSCSSRMRERQEDFVVHGQAEQEGEHRDGDPDGDGAEGGLTEQRLGADAVLPDQHGDAVCGADGDDVQDQRLDG